MSVDLFDVKVLDSDVDKALVNLTTLLSSAGMMAFLNISIGPCLRKRAKDRFASEGDDASGKWAALEPTTVAIRESGGYPGAHPINRRTGELENWVVNSGWDAYPTGFGATMKFPGKPTGGGELLNKVRVAQKGGQAPGAGKPTPPRPVLAVDETDLLHFQTMLALAVGEAIK